MLYRVRKILCYTLIIALLNTSFYPLYAVIQSSTPEEECNQRRPVLLYDVMGGYSTRKVQPFLPWGLRLRNKIIDTGQKIKENTLDFVKDATSTAVTRIDSSLNNMVSELPEHLKSNKAFWEINFAQDPKIWQALFTTAIEELKTTWDQERLEAFQDIVGTGLLSPCEYEQGLAELRSHYKANKKKKMLQELITLGLSLEITLEAPPFSFPKISKEIF